MNPFLCKFFFSSNNIPRILNVAEKPSIARKITELLSMNSFSKEFSQSKYNPIYKFHYDMSHLDPSFIDTIMYFTSVSGHINTLSYVNDYKKWDKVNPFDLFEGNKQETQFL